VTDWRTKGKVGWGVPRTDKGEASTRSPERGAKEMKKRRGERTGRFSHATGST